MNICSCSHYPAFWGWFNTINKIAEEHGHCKPANIPELKYCPICGGLLNPPAHVEVVL